MRIFLLVCLLLLVSSVYGLPTAKVPSHVLSSGPLASPAALIETAAETDTEAHSEQAAELVASLRQMLESRKQSEAEARSKLEAAAQHTIQVEHVLAEKSAQLKAHNAMLTRLEQCLNSGPAEARYAKLQAQVAAQEHSLMEEHSTINQASELLKQQQQQLEKQQKELQEKESALKNKESELAHSKSEIDAHAALIAIQQKQLETSEHAAQLESAETQKAIEKAVAAKVAAAKAALEAEHEVKIAALKAAMQSQIQQSMTESETSLIQRKAAQIASVHAFHEMTSVDDDDLSPYAQQAAASEQDAESTQQAIAHLPEDTSSISLLEASATTHVMAGNASTWADKLNNHCAQYDSCHRCSKDGRCGWCSAGGNGGQCLSLDVNSNIRRGSTGAGDGLTSGRCTSDNWQTAVAARLTFLTLNVFASERANSTRRFAAIIQLIKKASPDVVALQEVEKWFVHALQAHSWVKNNYHFSEYGPGQAPGGLYILSRYPIAGTSYYEEIQPGQVEVSQRGRVLVAKLGVKQQAVYVATTVLDWRSSENRANNLKFITTTLKPYAHVVLLGDFNFDEGSKLESNALPASYIDLWPTLIPDKPGYTWDPRSNWFAAASDPLARASRIDRVYIRSNQWMPRSIHLVGCSVSDPLCGAKNLDQTTGLTIIDSNKANPALILGAPTNKEDRKAAEVAAPEWGTKIFLESQVAMELAGTAEHAQIVRALSDAAELDESLALVETGSVPKPTFERDFVPSNHFGLLVQATQFAPKCPLKDE